MPDAAAALRFQEDAVRAAVAIRARPRGTLWHLGCDTDADGLCAAAVLAQALLRVGHRFVVRASRAKDEAHYRALCGEAWEGLILLDKGTSHLATLAQHAGGRPVVVVDHHNLRGEVPAGVVLLNPRHSGLDGSRDASGATTALALALALVGEDALAWAGTALSGAMGDWQHNPRWQGWNLEVLERGVAKGTVRMEPFPSLPGVTLAEALTHTRPPTPGLDRDLDASSAFLARLGLSADLEAEELDAEERTRLMSALALQHLANGAGAADVARLVVPTEWHTRLQTSLRHVFRVADACGRQGRTATGIAYLMGDTTARAEASAAFSTYKTAISTALRALRAAPAQRRRALQVAWTADPDFTGMVAGIAMMFLADTSVPLCVLARRADGLVQVSTRGLEPQVAAGMDLGAACQHAAAHVGSEGGGHPVAAGAVIPGDRVEAFLLELDTCLAAQPWAAPPPGTPGAGVAA